MTDTDLLKVPNIPDLYERDFCRKLDHYLEHGWMDADDYATCSDAQRIVVQCVKRSIARITKRV